MLNFHLPNARLKLGHGSTATLHCHLVGFGKTVLQLVDLRFQGPLGLLLVGSVVLLSAELISQPGGIDHCLLGLVLRVLGLVEAVIDLSMESVAGGLQLPLLSHGLGVDGGHVINGTPGLSQIHLALLLAPVGRVQESPGLLQLSMEGVGLALGKSGLLGNLDVQAVLLLKGSLNLALLVLVALDGLECLSIGLVGMVKSDLKLIDVRFKLLLDAKSFSLGPRLSLQGSLHGVHSSLVVLASVVELFFLLLNLPVNLLPDLSKLKLGTKDLILLLLKSSLSLLKGSLELLLLNLQATALLVKLVDGPATIPQLVQEILDLISQVLVLPLDNIQLLNSLIPGSLETEQLAVVVPALLLAGINLSSQVINLGLPFSDDLIEVLAPLFSNDGCSVDTLVLKLKILQLSLKAHLGLLSAGNLLVQGLDGLFSLSKAGADLGLGSLKLINAAKTLSLVLGPPQLNLSLGLGQSLQSIRFLLILLLDAVLQALKLSVQALELAQERSPVPCLSITHPLGILELGGEGDLVLAKGSNSSLSLLNLAGQVLVLNLQLLPG